MVLIFRVTKTCVFTSITIIGGLLSVAPSKGRSVSTQGRQNDLTGKIGIRQRCEGCFYQKVRDVDQKTGELAFGPFCLESGQPVRCEQAVINCELRPALAMAANGNKKSLKTQTNNNIKQK